MLLADFFGDLFGNACLWLILILGIIGSLIAELFKNEGVQDAAEFTFWSWFFSGDD